MQERPEEREEHEEAGEREYVIRIKVPKFPRVMPDETRRHAMAAGREVLLVFRSVLDAAIEGLETGSKPEEKGPTKIEVE